MTKFKVSFNVDVSHIVPELTEAKTEVETEAVEEIVTSMIFENARAFARSELHKIRKDQELDPDVKAYKMAEQLRKMMLSLMAQANLEVESIDEDTFIQTELPFERQAA